MSDSIAIGQLRDQARSRITPKVRWYRGYSGRGKADNLVEQLSRYLHQQRLTDTVCGLRIERRPKREFYFFLAFETDHFGCLPDSIDEALKACPLLQFEVGTFELQQIQGMVSGELKIKALGQCLTYRRMKQEVADDPLRVDLSRDTGDALTPAPVTGERAEQLLWYLSALGSGPWSTFRAACRALGMGEQVRRLARNLRLLGHLELSANGDRWSVTPPHCVRARGPDGAALRFWTGARSATTPGVRELQPFGPARLRVVEAVRGELEHPAEKLGAVLPTLDEYRAGLEVVGGVSALGEVAKFDGLAFRPVSFSGEAGLYEVTQGGRTMTLLYSDGRWLRGDWYGLRYLTLHTEGLLTPGHYDAASWTLVLPADQRPPELFERALVLASGLLPSRRGAWLLYPNISLEVARAVATRLSIDLTDEVTGE